MISSTTSWAGVVSVPSPAVAVPRSFTTTRAPSAASSRVCAPDPAAGSGDDGNLAVQQSPCDLPRGSRESRP